MYKSWEQYKSGEQDAPPNHLVWHLYGVGLETLGRDKSPEVKPMYEPGPDELLARVDCAGLCFSDTKIIKLGGDHPRLYGRDLASDPIVPGHEAAITIIAVGENREEDYSVGDRFVVQAVQNLNQPDLAGMVIPQVLYIPVPLLLFFFFGHDFGGLAQIFARLLVGLWLDLGDQLLCHVLPDGYRSIRGMGLNGCGDLFVVNAVPPVSFLWKPVVPI